MSDVSVTLFIEIVSLYAIILAELLVLFSMFGEQINLGETPQLISFVSSLVIVIVRGACQLNVAVLASEGAIKSSNEYFKVLA